MSDYFPAEIHIGGPIQRATLDGLIGAILDGRTCLDEYGGPPATEAAVLNSLKEGHILSLCDDQATFGEFEDLEAFLVEHEIHFDRHNDARYEFNAENIHYRGGPMPVAMASNQDGQDLVRCRDVLAIVRDSALDKETKLKAIGDLVSPPQLSPLEPIQLTGDPPCPPKQD